MDNETRSYFDKMSGLISDVKSTLDIHVAFSEGEKLPERLKDVEDDMELVKTEKASWNGLYLLGTILLLITVAACGAAWAIAKGI